LPERRVLHTTPNSINIALTTLAPALCPTLSSPLLSIPSSSTGSRVHVYTRPISGEHLTRIALIATWLPKHIIHLNVILPQPYHGTHGNNPPCGSQRVVASSTASSCPRRSFIFISTPDTPLVLLSACCHCMSLAVRIIIKGL